MKGYKTLFKPFSLLNIKVKSTKNTYQIMMFSDVKFFDISPK
jgi:hypothetical protein